MTIDNSQFDSRGGSDSNDSSIEDVGIPVNPEVTISGEKLTKEITGFELKQPIDSHHELRLFVRTESDLTDIGGMNDEIDKFTRLMGESISVVVKHTMEMIGDDITELSFVGKITGIELVNKAAEVDKIVIVAKSPTILMDSGKQNAFFMEQKASDIISAIVRSRSITPGTLEATDTTMKFCVQYRETDYDFVMRLASGAGLFAFYDGEKFYVTKGGVNKKISLSWGNTLSEFNFKWNTGPLNFKSGVFDYETNKTYGLQAKSSSISLSDISRKSKDASESLYTGEGFHEETQSSKDNKTVDKSIEIAQRRAFGRLITCTGVSLIPAVRVGHRIKVENMGKLNTDYLVLSVTHTLSEHGLYHNKFVCAPIDVAHTQLHSKRRTTTEIQSAVVVDNNDPETLGRVKISFPWLEGDETIWVRVASPHAGKEHGWYSIPEVEDEVLVAYEHGSPDRPIIIGALYNGKDKPSGDLVDPENNRKGFITKSGNKIVLDDTGGEEQISITAKDGTQVILDAAAPSVTVKTTGDITLDGNNITIKASGKVAVEGNGIELKSSGDLKAEGSMNLGLKGGIETKIEGTMVTVKGNPIQLN